jgi:hypothetical protein
MKLRVETRQISRIPPIRRSKKLMRLVTLPRDPARCSCTDKKMNPRLIVTGSPAMVLTAYHRVRRTENETKTELTLFGGDARNVLLMHL